MSYTEDAASAYADILAAGVALSFQRSTTSVTDAVTGTVSQSVSTFVLPGVILAPRVPPSEGFRIQSEIRNNNRKVLVGVASGVTAPEVGDVVTIGGALWTVTEVDALRPDGTTAILFTLRVTR